MYNDLQLFDRFLVQFLLLWYERQDSGWVGVISSHNPCRDNGMQCEYYTIFIFHVWMSYYRAGSKCDIWHWLTCRGLTDVQTVMWWPQISHIYRLPFFLIHCALLRARERSATIPSASITTGTTVIWTFHCRLSAVLSSSYFSIFSFSFSATFPSLQVQPCQ